MNAQEIKAELMIPNNGMLDDYERGWNSGVNSIDYPIREEPGYYENGFYVDEPTEWERGHNEGRQAALDLKEGKEVMATEKTPEQIAYEQRMKCFTMAEKYQPVGAIHGADREPIGATIARAEALYNYFSKGAAPGAVAGE